MECFHIQRLAHTLADIHSFQKLYKMTPDDHTQAPRTAKSSAALEGPASSIPLLPIWCRILTPAWTSDRDTSETPVSVCCELPWYLKHWRARWWTPATKDIPAALCHVWSIRTRDGLCLSSHSYTTLQCLSNRGSLLDTATPGVSTEEDRNTEAPFLSYSFFGARRYWKLGKILSISM